MIVLNWLPFGSSQSGARRRALELTRRITGRSFVAFASQELVSSLRFAPGNVTFEVSATRTRLLRVLAEGRSRWWRKEMTAFSVSVWSTDTLPVIRIPGVMSILTVHDLRYLENRRYVSLERYLLYKLRMKDSLEKADRVIAVSEWVADQMVDRLGVERTKVRIVPNGVDPSIALAAVGSTPPGSPYLLSVGHLEPRKNQQDLIRALAYLGNRWHGRVILVGRDFGTSTTLQRLATDLGVADRVIFVGEVDEAELARLYRWSSMVICTAEYEGFGMTPLEAFVHQRPVVASSIPTHREVAGAAAFYYDLDGSAEARAGRLGEAILTVLSERDQTTELVKRGCDRTKLFTWDRAAQLLDRVYEECEGRGQ